MYIYIFNLILIYRCIYIYIIHIYIYIYRCIFTFLCRCIFFFLGGGTWWRSTLSLYIYIEREGARESGTPPGPQKYVVLSVCFHYFMLLKRGKRGTWQRTFLDIYIYISRKVRCQVPLFPRFWKCSVFATSCSILYVHIPVMVLLEIHTDCQTSSEVANECPESHEDSQGKGRRKNKHSVRIYIYIYIFP